MCIFTGEVDHVSKTQIFARPSADGSQVLVYSMRIGTPSEVAMVLPLPVPPGSPEDSVKFIDLERYPDFFDDMEEGFLPPEPRFTSTFGPTLKVHEVGSFVASFVPSNDDWDRLDDRFRLPEAVWSDLPAYADFGFAVFKLKRTPPGGIRRIHPMAFTFPRRNPHLLFFPTVHVHDGRVRRQARFDHRLYCQIPAVEPERLTDRDWTASRSEISHFVDIDKSRGTVRPGLPCFRRDIQGRRRNEDIQVRA